MSLGEELLGRRWPAVSVDQSSPGGFSPAELAETDLRNSSTRRGAAVRVILHCPGRAGLPPQAQEAQEAPKSRKSHADGPRLRLSIRMAKRRCAQRRNRTIPAGLGSSCTRTSRSRLLRLGAALHAALGGHSSGSRTIHQRPGSTASGFTVQRVALAMEPCWIRPGPRHAEYDRYPAYRLSLAKWKRRGRAERRHAGPARRRSRGYRAPIALPVAGEMRPLAVLAIVDATAARKTCVSCPSRIGRGLTQNMRPDANQAYRASTVHRVDRARGASRQRAVGENGTCRNQALPSALSGALARNRAGREMDQRAGGAFRCRRWGLAVKNETPVRVPRRPPSCLV